MNGSQVRGDCKAELRATGLHEGIIYGPVQSRRLGRSLGINLLGMGGRVCQLDCVYCQLRDPRPAPPRRRRCALDCARCPDSLRAGLGRAKPTLPDAASVLEALETALRARGGLEDICFSGNGEPTLHPAFTEIAQGARRLRDRFAAGAQLSILSNATTLSVPAVQRGLAELDVPVMKLDVGNAAALARLNRPCNPVRLAAIVDNLAALESFVLQTMLVAGPAGNAADEDVADWLAILAALRPREVQLYTLSRVPAEASTLPLANDRLEEIAGAVRDRIGLPVAVY